MSDPYVDRAVEIALEHLHTAFAEANLGTLESWDIYEGEQGTVLRLFLTSTVHEGRPIRYARVIKPAPGPDKDPELAGMIYATAFEERLHTREPTPDPEGKFYQL